MKKATESVASKKAQEEALSERIGLSEFKEIFNAIPNEDEMFFLDVWCNGALSDLGIALENQDLPDVARKTAICAQAWFSALKKVNEDKSLTNRKAFSAATMPMFEALTNEEFVEFLAIYFEQDLVEAYTELMIRTAQYFEKKILKIEMDSIRLG